MYSDLQPNMLYCWKWGCWTPLKKTRELEPPAHTAGAQQCLLPVPPHQFQPRPMILPPSKAHAQVSAVLGRSWGQGHKNGQHTSQESKCSCLFLPITEEET